MKKVVKWGDPQLQNPNSPFLKKTKTFKQLWETGQKMHKEQEQALEYLNKAMPGLLAIFDLKAQRGEPFLVMRPLQYRTSVMASEQDDGFYHVRKSESSLGKFVDTVKTITPGNQLILKGFDRVLNEYLFVDGMGNEHAISTDEKNLLLTQTDVFEIVKSFIENKGE